MTAVLFVRLSAMGDVVHGLGAVAALHEARPDWRLVFVTQTTTAPLLRDLPGVARVVLFERRGGLSALWRLRRALREEPFDFALDLQGNWKSALIARLAGARTSLGMTGEWAQEPASRVLLRRSVREPGVPHPAMAAWHLVRAIAPEVSFRAARLVATPAEVTHERRALAAIGVDACRPFRVVVVTDGADPRALRPECVVDLARDPQLPVLYLLGPAEADVAPPTAAFTMRHGAGEVRRLIALGGIVAAAGGEVVGPDQGATHVLAAAGASCRVLFGSQDPRRTAPVDAKVFVHVSPPPCSPCRRSRCDHPSGPVCMAFTPATGRAVAVDWPRC
ncbi:MAG: glycosyltransferase family 9 protein [Planctomycetota bacterium]